MTEPNIAPDTRIRAFDLARGVAIVWMIMVHSVAHYGNEASWASPFTQVLIAAAGSTGAPVFMFLMGASIAFSRRTSAVRIARRGLWLLALAYTLNILRGVLPASLGLGTGFITEADISPYTPPTLLTLVDIHQMAGLALLVIAVLVAARFILPVLPAVLVGLAVVVAVASPLLWGTTTGTPLDLFLMLLWGANWNVFFPLFPWIVYPLVGLAYGRALVSRPDRRRFIRWMGVAGVGVFVAGIVVTLALHPTIGMDAYWRQRPGILLGILGVTLSWLAVADVLVERVRHNRVFEQFYSWSPRVTAMYCIHWILIGWGVGILGHRDLELPAVLVVMVVLLFLTDRITLALPFLRGPRSRTPSSAERSSTLVPAEA